MAPKYSVGLLERLQEIIGPETMGNDSEVTLVYSFTQGYEKLDIQRNDIGGMSFAGSYHPNGVCEGGGVCMHCGRTL